MLLQLDVSNLVLIEEEHLELGPGFHVLTGETGAGKSMLVDALGLVLGIRARPDWVRAGAKEAEVSALFDVATDAEVLATLEGFGIPVDSGELVVRRIVQGEGRSRAYLNGRMATAAQLQEIGPLLCDIASQHESVRLTDAATHGAYLDAYAGLDAMRAELVVAFQELQVLEKRRDTLQSKLRTRAEQEDYLSFQLREIDELDPKEGEETELLQRRGRLRHAERLGKATREAADRLYESENAICDELHRLSGELAQAAELDGSLAPLARTVDAARAELADAARELGRYAEGVEANPAELAELEERTFRLQKLLRKHGPTTSELLAERARIEGELKQLAGGNEELAEVGRALEAKLEEAALHARRLSMSRRAAADALADAIGRELGKLAMGRARVVVDVAELPAEKGALLVDGARLGPFGIDRVEFLIAPNPGESPKPLRRIASGGELSRALLALKRVLAEKGPRGTYVFDEVDAGVSGAVAEVIGQSIREIAAHRQVLCITHLPQIAALADVHWVVEKAEKAGRTNTSVRKLTAEERVDEVARMIGGVKVGQAARSAASELLQGRGVAGAKEPTAKKPVKRARH